MIAVPKTGLGTVTVVGTVEPVSSFASKVETIEVTLAGVASAETSVLVLLVGGGTLECVTIFVELRDPEDVGIEIDVVVCRVVVVADSEVVF